jgi:hypothetical protein
MAERDRAPETGALWDYAKRATAAISEPGDRAAARDELYEHAVARYEELRAAGAPEADAVRGALQRLGDPSEYAADLRGASRSALSPGNLAAVVVACVLVALVVIGLVAWFFWANGAFTPQ